MITYINHTDRTIQDGETIYFSGDRDRGYGCEVVESSGVLIAQPILEPDSQLVDDTALE